MRSSKLPEVVRPTRGEPCRAEAIERQDGGSFLNRCFLEREKIILLLE